MRLNRKSQVLIALIMASLDIPSGKWEFDSVPNLQKGKTYDSSFYLFI